jgi:hypothetical protein
MKFLFIAIKSFWGVDPIAAAICGGGVDFFDLECIVFS